MLNTNRSKLDSSARRKPNDWRSYLGVKTVVQHWNLHFLDFWCSDLYLRVSKYFEWRIYLDSATCLQKTGSETGFSVENLDRLLDRLCSGPFFRQERRTGFKERNRTCDSLFRRDRVSRQDPVLHKNLSKVLSPVLEPCSASLSNLCLLRNPV